MSTLLSKLINNLCEIYSKKSTDKNCKSECEFKSLKNKNLPYNCKVCIKKQLKPINGLIKSFQLHTSFETMILTILFCY